MVWSQSAFLHWDRLTLLSLYLSLGIFTLLARNISALLTGNISANFFSYWVALLLWNTLTFFSWNKCALLICTCLGTVLQLSRGIFLHFCLGTVRHCSLATFEHCCLGTLWQDCLGVTVHCWDGIDWHSCLWNISTCFSWHTLALLSRNCCTW